MNAPVLIAALHWGLGHATRCMPLIRRYLAANRPVVLASDGAALTLLKQSFPNLPAVELPAYDIRYDKNPVWMLLKEGNRIRNVIQAEYQATQEIVDRFDIQEIVSDNRYGVWSPNCLNKFVCHQLAPLPPKILGFLHFGIYQAHLQFLKPFQEILIPDFEGINNLSGDLAHKFPLPSKAKFIGILSRFEGLEMPQKYELEALNDFNPQIVAVLSGPEPQRSFFQQSLEKRFENTEKRILMVLGKPNEADLLQQIPLKGMLKIPHLQTPDMAKVISSADLVISRSGYSSLMDYHFLKPKAVELHATPHQTEQEYLAVRWKLYNH